MHSLFKKKNLSKLEIEWQLPQTGKEYLQKPASIIILNGLNCNKKLNLSSSRSILKEKGHYTDINCSYKLVLKNWKINV